LASGVEVLHKEGLGTGVEHLTFKKVLDNLEATSGIRITPASLIRRVWFNQEEFQLDVVRFIINEQGDEEVSNVTDALAETFGLIDVSSLAMRKASLTELIRVTAMSYINSASNSRATIQTALATYMVAGGAVGENDDLVEMFKETNERLTNQYVALYEAALGAVGLRVKPGLTIRQVAVAISTLSEGVLLRHMVEPDAFEPVTAVRELDGTTVEWELFGFGMNTIVGACIEEDPEWESPLG
jgi:hypothetical protein